MSTAPKSKNKRTKKSSAKAVRIILWAVCGIVLITGLSVTLPYFLTGSAQAAIIRIPKGAMSDQVSDSLSKYFGEKYADLTIDIFNHLESRPFLRYGAYEIPEGTSPANAARILARGVQAPVKITINGVREFAPFADRIAAKFNFTGDDLRSVLANKDLAAQYGLTPEQFPALFMNDTYFFYWTTTPTELIEKIGENYNKFWNQERRQKASALGLTPAEVMIVASITDEETNQIYEKGRIGRLYINRLHKGMRLQADPTVKFALKDFSIRRITQEHLSTPSEYNTYRVTGLPPGPIRTTSKETVDAILNSQPSNDLYMCAKEDFSGFHNFAATYAEHQENARRYRKALDERGIF